MNNDFCNSSFVPPDETILITGSGGFIGSRVVEGLLDRGFRKLVCFARSSDKMARIQDAVKHRYPEARLKIVEGNLLSRQDCEAAVKGVAVIYHLAAGIGEKSYPDAFMNSVVTTRNLLEACLRHAHLRRFVLVSSFAVYTNRRRSPAESVGRIRARLRSIPNCSGDAYCFAKVKQEQIVAEY